MMIFYLKILVFAFLLKPQVNADASSLQGYCYDVHYNLKFASRFGGVNIYRPGKPFHNVREPDQPVDAALLEKVFRQACAGSTGQFDVDRCLKSTNNGKGDAQSGHTFMRLVAWSYTCETWEEYSNECAYQCWLGLPGNTEKCVRDTLASKSHPKSNGHSASDAGFPSLATYLLIAAIILGLA